jgi:hypothetical protein
MCCFWHIFNSLAAKNCATAHSLRITAVDERGASFDEPLENYHVNINREGCVSINVNININIEFLLEAIKNELLFLLKNLCDL